MKDLLEKIKLAAYHIPELIVIFVSPAAVNVGIVTLAILTDTVTAIWAAKKKSEEITSKKASPLLYKFLVYWLLILLAHGIDLSIGMEYALKVITLALLGMELMSIDENFRKATGKSIFKPVIEKIKKR